MKTHPFNLALSRSTAKAGRLRHMHTSWCLGWAPAPTPQHSSPALRHCGCPHPYKHNRAKDHTEGEQDGAKEEWKKTAFTSRDTTVCMSPGEGGKLGHSRRHCCRYGCVCVCLFYACMVAPQGDFWGPHSIPTLTPKSSFPPLSLYPLCPPCTA